MMEFNLRDKQEVFEKRMGVYTQITDEGKFKAFNVEYDVLTRQERVAVAVTKVVKDISYMNPSFLAQMTGMEPQVFDKLVGEDDAVAKIVECSTGLKRLVEQVAKFDGWEHMLATDKKEIKLDDKYFAYRVN